MRGNDPLDETWHVVSQRSMNMFAVNPGYTFVWNQRLGEMTGDEKHMDVLESYANLDAKSFLQIDLEDKRLMAGGAVNARRKLFNVMIVVYKDLDLQLPSATNSNNNDMILTWTLTHGKTTMFGVMEPCF